MRPIALDKPGRKYVFHSTSNWCLYGHAAGACELERRRDGATIVLLDNEADCLRDDVVRIERAWPDSPIERDRAFDLLCDFFSDYM